MKKITRSSAIILLLSAVVSSTLFAGGDKFSPRIVGMGRTFTALSRGLDAVGTNPANLALDDRNATFTLNLVPLGFQVGSDLFNYKIYNDYFTGIPDPNDPNNRISKPLNDNDKKEILGLFPDGIARTQMRFEIAPIGFSLQIGNFGFALVPSVLTAVNLDLSEGYMKFALNGLEDGGSFYSFNGTALNASAVAEVNASLAYILPLEFPNVNEISVGVGVKYLQGLAFIGTDRYNASIETVGDTYIDPNSGESIFVPKSIKGNFEFLQYVALDTTDFLPVGRGMGYDIGLSALLFNSIRIGASVTDIGSITWDKYTKAIVGKSNFELKGAGDKEGQDSLAKAFKGETKDTTAFTYNLPTAIHLGVEARIDDIVEAIPFRWTVAADVHLGLNEVAGNTKIPQFALGMELDPLAGWLPLRTGILLGGRDRFAWSAGFGLHLANTFDLDFATQSIAILTNPNGFRTGSLTMGMRFRF
jgi:hypothetical protein